MTNRREFIRTSAQLTLLAPFSRFAYAAPANDPRLVLVILRGGLDGLAAVAPYADPQYQSLRGELALGAPGAPGSANGALKLDGLFALHPALQNMHAMYNAGELSIMQSVATPYRERSHFDGQKVLEAGGISPATSAGGWLNRALTAMSAQGEARQGIALAPSVPLILRGPYNVTSWSPSRLPDADDDTLERIRGLYEASDATLAARLTEALSARDIAAGMSAAAGGNAGGIRGQALSPLTAAAGRFLSDAEGPRIAVLDVGGWDTHANQGAENGNLATRLGALDRGLQSLKQELGANWRSTTVMIVTEFGRTVAVNGTRGTDHGTAGCAFIAGGAINGGKLIADWPGLAARDLHEGRDLRATLDLRAAFKGILHAQFGLSETTLETAVFPDSAEVKPMSGLI